MSLLLRGAGILVAATLLVTLLVWIVLRLRGRTPRRYWRRAVILHLGLFALHLFVTVPAVMGWFGSRMAQTRSDERAYAGPRLDGAGRWLEQSRESLAAETEGTATVDAALAAAAAARAVSLTAEDEVPLRAWLVPPVREPARATVEMSHGLFRGGLELEPVGRMFRDLGCEVVMLELRNHGGSGRAQATFGRDEARDVIAAVRWLRARPGRAANKIVLFGVSLGTAASGLATAELDDLAGVVLDAPIDEVAPTADRMFAIKPRPGRRGLALPQPFRWLVLESLQLWSGVRFADVQPGAALRALPPTVPVLLIAGGGDRRVPPDTVRVLFEDLPTDRKRKRLWVHPTAEHGRVWLADPDGYRQRLAAFMRLID